MDGLDTAAFYFVVATVEHGTQLGDFSEIGGHGVFDEVVGRPTALGREFVEARFCFGLEAHFHERSLRSGRRLCQKEIG